MIVALATVVVVALQTKAHQMSHAADWITVLGIAAIPIGSCAGSLAGRLRTDRFLVIAGFGLAVPGFLAFLALVAHHEVIRQVATRLIATSAIPITIAAAVLERWTRPAAPIPPVTPEHQRLRWYRPRPIELAVGLAVVASAIVATMIVLGDQPLPEYTRWYKNESAVDVHDRPSVFLFLACSAIPVAVLLGRLAARLTRGRLIILAAVAAVGMIWIATLTAFFTPIEFDSPFVIPPLVLVIVLERTTRARRDATPFGPAMIGMLCGAANAIAIATAMFLIILQHETEWSPELLGIPCVALLFSVPAGALLGGLAGRVSHNRRTLLNVLALGAVVLLALGFELPLREPSALGIFLWSCTTTAIAVHVLERATRPAEQAGGSMKSATQA